MYIKVMRYKEAEKLLKEAPIGHKVIVANNDKIVSSKMAYLSIGVPAHQRAGLLRSCGYCRSHHISMCWIKKRDGYVASRYQASRVSSFAAEDEIVKSLDTTIEYKNADVRRLTRYPVTQDVINEIMVEAGFSFDPKKRIWRFK